MHCFELIKKELAAYDRMHIVFLIAIRVKKYVIEPQ